MYACIIADIFEAFAAVEECMIMGDVTFGACCIDDFSAAALGADFLVHYGHSCLIPVDVTSMPAMYVFVDIKMDVQHFVESVSLTLPASSRIVLAGTIQFASSIQIAREKLLSRGYIITVPQSRPLSPGEVLGCTAPRLPPREHDAIVFVADGRFHLEALMIANPDLPAYRYDPYGRILTREKYDHLGMKAARRKAVEAAAMNSRDSQTSANGIWGLILGTLGRQGNPHILKRLQNLLDARGKTYVTVLLSEVTPAKLAMLGNSVDVWVQIACPRLSIDWGEEFDRPTLNPYEAFVALGEAPGWWQVEGINNESKGDGRSTVTAAGEKKNYEKNSDDAQQRPWHDCEQNLCGCKKGNNLREATYPMDYYATEGGEYNSSYHRISKMGSKASQARDLQTAGRKAVAERLVAMKHTTSITTG